MDIETHTNQQQNADRTYYIVFDKNGAIHNINSTPVAKLKDSSMTQIESTNPVCKKIIKGEANLKKYGIIWDIVSNKWNISKRSTKLVLEADNNKLLPYLTNTNKNDVEIFISIYSEDNIAVIYANTYKIKSIKNLSDITEISTSETELLDVYVTKRNDPDYLVTILKLNPLQLFTTGTQVIKLDTEVTKHIDWQNVSMYGKTVFENYGWRLLNKKYSAPISSNNTVLQTSEDADRSSININVVDNNLIVHSNLSQEQDYYFEGLSNLRIVVCDKIPDNFVGAFELPCQPLIDGEIYNTTIDFKWPTEPLLLYKSKYITISTGEKDVR